MKTISGFVIKEFETSPIYSPPLFKPNIHIVVSDTNYITYSNLKPHYCHNGYSILMLIFIVGPIKATLESKVQASGPSSVKEPTTKSQPSARPQLVKDWTIDHVHEWLQENRLAELCETLHFCEGSHLEKMYTQHQRNEDNFKAELKSDFNMTGPTCLQFTVALEKLFEKQKQKSDMQTRQSCCLII